MHAIQKLSTIQYDAIMQAIDTYKDILQAHEDGYMFDDTGETNYTNTGLLQALEEVEEIIMVSNIPF